MNGERRIRNEKLREQQYMERYARRHNSKRVEWGGGRNAEENVRASVRKMCGSSR